MSKEMLSVVEYRSKAVVVDPLLLQDWAVFCSIGHHTERVWFLPTGPVELLGSLCDGSIQMLIQPGQLFSLFKYMFICTVNTFIQSHCKVLHSLEEKNFTLFFW